MFPPLLPVRATISERRLYTRFCFGSITPRVRNAPCAAVPYPAGAAPGVLAALWRIRRSGRNDRAAPPPDYIIIIIIILRNSELLYFGGDDRRH